MTLDGAKNGTLNTVPLKLIVVLIEVYVKTGFTVI